jgi:glycosyltransferase involved in cell wall biosynthesis
MKVSACIICFNEERNIRRCLESVAWADEIVVLDSMSEDKTVDMAKAYTDRIYQRAWTGYVDQKKDTGSPAVPFTRADGFITAGFIPTSNSGSLEESRDIGSGGVSTNG